MLPLWTTVVGLLLWMTQWDVTTAQGCSNQCPPINYGTLVPALCEGDGVREFANVEKQYDICHPASSSSFAVQELRGNLTVLANYYTGCNAGRRESGVFAHVAMKYKSWHPHTIQFIQSIKGGGTCHQWASLWIHDAAQLYPHYEYNGAMEPDESSSSSSNTSAATVRQQQSTSDIAVQRMPWSVNDVQYELRDDFFTTPFGHPSYVILDAELNVRHKFMGPCCGYESYFDCTPDIAKTLEDQLDQYLTVLLQELPAVEEKEETEETPVVEEEPATSDSDVPQDQEESTESCLQEPQDSDYTEWSSCSIACGLGTGVQFRHLSQGACTNPSTLPWMQTRYCTASLTDCPEEGEVCIPEIGSSYELITVATGFSSPRDVAFHPTPGYHLGSYSEGRPFYPNQEQNDDEAWVVNGANHSVSIVTSIGTVRQSTLSRRDRGYYHYMINVTAISFNTVADSGRTPDRDSFRYFAVCNDNRNTYLDAKEPNYFMGPTLYNTDPQNWNLVNRAGQVCGDSEPCYFLHADMLHESPACIGITHDPELQTTHGTVYWAWDSTGSTPDDTSGQLVRFDFQQPHGPGSMDHSVAAVRRYPEIPLSRNSNADGVHAGMVVHPDLRQVFISSPGTNEILVVGADSGSFARSAREEYPIFSNRLPSFEYSIWECVDHGVFARNLDTPSGMALSADGERLFVAERGTGIIWVLEVASGAVLDTIPTNLNSIGGMSIAPNSQVLHLVDDETNALYAIQPSDPCTAGAATPTRLSVDYQGQWQQAQAVYGDDDLSVYRDYSCVVDPVIPDSENFDQVHVVDTGYADENPDVQGMAGMNAEAALLANRTDCGYDSSNLNLDALLLGGYFCHRCLPDLDSICDPGGHCNNIQWNGFVCDNEFHLTSSNGAALQYANGTQVAQPLVLLVGVTYRIIVSEEDLTVCWENRRSGSICATRGPLMIPVTAEEESPIALTVNNGLTLSLHVEQKEDDSDLDETDTTSTSGVNGATVPLGVAALLLLFTLVAI